MAKGNGNKKQAAAKGNEKPMPAYFKSLTIENVKCFKGEHTIDLSDGKGKPAQWTVILGNNNTGKTTILKCLAGLEPYEVEINAQDGSTQTYLLPIFMRRNFITSFLSRDPDFRLFSEIYFCGKLASKLSKGVFSTLGNFLWGKAKSSFPLLPKGRLSNLLIYSYGASRKMSRKPLSESQGTGLHSSLFENEEITNVEDWLLNLFAAQQLKQEQAEPVLELAKEILISGILPDVKEVRLNSRKKDTSFENFVEFRTDFGWIRLRDLGYGYQTMIAWVLDLVKRMVERYPGSPDPLAEPAIVLVDEIDLHLHPDWQRRIIAHLTKYFPNTQFIVTAHSPLVVQSAEEINLVILKKEGESVHIEQPKIRTFRGWTVEEILTDLMALEGQTMSQTYLDLMQQFDDALDADDFEKAEAAYNELDKILHPNSHQRKLLQLQMTSLSPADAV